MKSALLAAGAAAAFVAVAGVMGVEATMAAAPATAAARSVDKVDNFQLTDQQLMAHELYYYKYAPAIVLMSQTNGSAVSQKAAAELEKIAQTERSKGVLFFMINSNLTDSRDQVAAEAKKQGFSIPVLMDEYQLVGENLGVKREGEVFVIDPKTWKVAYHGPVSQAAKAIASVAAGQAGEAVRIPVTTGKEIAFPQMLQKANFAKISYAKDIAPILQEKCVTCHLEGGIGPFTLDSYEKVKGFAPMIRETVRTRRMPPYFADPHIGKFKNDQGLTAEQTKTLVHWIEAGAPRGEGNDPLLANRGKRAPEWPEYLGKPDVIVEIPAFKVPATGIVEYQNQRVDNPFSEDTFLRAISIKPGDRRVLHHVVSNHVPDPTKPRSAIPGGSVGSYTPGAEAQVIAEGAGAPVPAGGKLNFQMHYTTFGKETTDKTQVGFYVLKEKPKYIKRSSVVSDFALFIPKGEARHKEVAYMTLPADIEIYTLYPHSHYRGMHVEFKAVHPDGREEMLLALPKYDFNWQRDYDPVEPIKLKKGTKLVATWVYDNSVYNHANPDPKINVTWGEQSHEEMMYFRFNYRFLDETVEKPRNDLQAALQASLGIGALDDNLNGKVELSELNGPRAQGLKARFAELDKNKDNALDSAEMRGVNARALARQGAEDIDL